MPAAGPAAAPRPARSNAVEEAPATPRAADVGVRLRVPGPLRRRAHGGAAAVRNEVGLLLLLLMLLLMRQGTEGEGALAASARQPTAAAAAEHGRPAEVHDAAQLRLPASARRSGRRGGVDSVTVPLPEPPALWLTC